MKEKPINRLRVRFDYADETYLYVHLAEEETLTKVRYNVPQKNEEFAATVELLWHDAQINLLDVERETDGTLLPSFIILEPDYLLDISSLAECIKDYGHHPANYFVSRLQTPENTRALLLGNIANLFLDEWIHATAEPDYRECMRKAFQLYSIELASCADLRERDKELQFFADCKLHFDNIRQTVTETFGAVGYDLNKKDAVLEPTYICEAMGLQGRLDYMQRDMTSFIEMKSGKADEYAVRGKVLPKANNRLQMLLYQAVLEYSMGMSHQFVKPYLLYTRYPLLYPARPQWNTVRKAMDLRNRIVAMEFAIQLRNSVTYTEGQLAQLHPDVLNEKGLDNVLWKRFLLPQLERIPRQLAALTEIEKSYFYTLYNFITKELCMAKLGTINFDGRVGAAALWNTTLAEKCEAGEILYDLFIKENRASELHKPYIVLSHSSATDRYPVLPNFRAGDAVVLYQRNQPSDNVTNKLVFKGNIERITEKEVVVRLRMSQQNILVLPQDKLYALEHDFMDTGYRAMYQSLAYFLQANEERRQLLVGERPPRFSEEWDAAIAAAEDDFQRITLKAQAAKDFFLLIGPPGTGKTSRALKGMVEAFYKEGKTILLLSYTNRAVDEICKTLAGILPQIDFIRMGSEIACDETYREHLVENVLQSCVKRSEVQQRMERCRVFVGTVATLGMKADLFRLKSFDVAIVDEATQILEPQLLGLLCMRNTAGANAIEKFIMIGDHKQLPAVVLQSPQDSEVHEEALRAIGLTNLKDSLFERLYRHLTNERAYDILTKQGRMNPEVASFPNEAFYEGVLQPVGLPHQQGDLFLAEGVKENDYASFLTKRVAYLPSEVDNESPSVKVNRSEARIAARLAVAVYQQYNEVEEFIPNKTLGIIAPYRSQIAMIRKELEATGIVALQDVVVDTVERFQGSERDVIIYSFCVNQAYQLQFLSNLTEDHGVLIDRKLNVALTRARKQMFLTGVKPLLELNPIYRKLISACG